MIILGCFRHENVSLKVSHEEHVIFVEFSLPKMCLFLSFNFVFFFFVSCWVFVEMSQLRIASSSSVNGSGVICNCSKQIVND